jgi:hypothetical protein
MATLSIEVQTALREDPYFVEFSIADADIVRLMTVLSALHGQDKTAGELMLILAEGWVTNTKRFVEARLAETAAATAAAAVPAVSVTLVDNG